MAGLRCHSCGADVNPFAERCDRCGADPEVTVVEIGAVGDDQVEALPRLGDGETVGGSADPAVTVVEIGGVGGNQGRGTAGPWRRSDGRRPWVLGLVAVAVVWATFAIVGSLGGDDEAASEASRAASDTTAASIRVPPTTATTTILSAVFDAPMLDEPIGLHLLTDTARALLDFDLDTGEIVEHRLGGQLHDGDERGVLVRVGRNYRWHPFPLGSAAVPLGDVALGAWLLQDTDAVWVLRPGEYAQLALLALDGSGVMATAPVPVPSVAYPVGVSGDLLVVAAAGRIFTIDTAGGVADLGSGVPVATGHGYAVIYRCEADLACGPVRVELATGETLRLDHLPAGPEDGALPLTPSVFGLERGWWVDPGGRVIYAAFGEGGAGLFSVDGASVTGVIQPGGSSSDLFRSVSFSPDGRWIVASGDGGVWLGTADGSTGLNVAPAGFTDGVVLLVPAPD